MNGEKPKQEKYYSKVRAEKKRCLPVRCNTSAATQKSLSTPSTAIIFQLEASAGAADNEAAVEKENNK